MRRIVITAAVALALVVSGCAGDATESDEYQELEAQLATTQEELATVRGELAQLQEEGESDAAVAAGATGMPADVAELFDEWLAAAERNDGSIADLYLPGGFHQYGDEKVAVGDIDAHLNSPGWTSEVISGPFLVVAEPEGRYVVTAGVRNTNASGGEFASALTFEFVTRDDELKVAETNWTYVTF